MWDRSGIFDLHSCANANFDGCTSDVMKSMRYSDETTCLKEAAPASPSMRRENLLLVSPAGGLALVHNRLQLKVSHPVPLVKPRRSCGIPAFTFADLPSPLAVERCTAMESAGDLKPKL